MKLDLIIKNGTIIDGNGSKPYQTDIGIKGKYIKNIGQLSPLDSENIIEAAGLIVCPGFIDIHSHSDYHLLINPQAESKLRQGVTTEAGGNCGYCAAPIGGEVLAERSLQYKKHFDLELDWQSLPEYQNRLQNAGISINYAPLVGHNTLRASVMGMQDRAPAKSELALMCKQLEQALGQGAYGLSTGFIYPPACYAKTDELIELAKIAKQYKTIFSAHIRGEGDNLLEAIQEMVEIAGCGVSTQISHLKAAGEKNWHKLDKVFEIIEDARNSGLRINADRYPYTASQTGLGALLPDWFFSGGIKEQLLRLKNKNTKERIKKHIHKNHPKENFWEKVIIARVTKQENRRYEGKSAAYAASLNNQDKLDFILDLLLGESMQVESLYFVMSEDNLRRILKKPYVMIGSDSAALADYGVLSKGKPHPRSFGSFPKIIRKYVRTEHMLSLPEAIYKMTYQPAEKLGLTRRGLLAPDYFADIVVFDLDKIADKSSYEQPFAYPEGIEYVLVNGKITVKGQEHTGQKAGMTLKKDSAL